jgi:hypothetical protein
MRNISPHITLSSESAPILFMHAMMKKPGRPEPLRSDNNDIN